MTVGRLQGNYPNSQFSLAHWKLSNQNHLKNFRYNTAKDLDYATKMMLAKRKFNMHACGEGFQPYFEDMTDEEGVKMALSIYGDIGFR